MSLINIDFSGLSEPGSKLIEKVSDAIGVLYEPRRIKKKAEAEAEAKKITALANLELNDIEQRGLERAIKQEARKQENIENITMQAAMQMEENDKLSEIDEDWIVHFFEECSNISDTDMQYIWSRILSGEAKKKGSYSKRTINLLSSLDKSDANLITKFGQFIWNTDKPIPIIYDTDDACIKKTGLTFEGLIHLNSIGIITLGTGYSLTYNQPKIRIGYFDKKVQITFQHRQENNGYVLSSGLALLTETGRQLINICGAKPNNEYFMYCINQWKNIAKVEIVNTNDRFQMKF